MFAAVYIDILFVRPTACSAALSVEADMCKIDVSPKYASNMRNAMKSFNRFLSFLPDARNKSKFGVEEFVPIYLLNDTKQIVK